MRIGKIEQFNHNQPVFYGKNRYARLAEKLAHRDIYSDTKPEEFVELRNIYNDLWKELGLPENLKPRLQYKAMLSNMSFSPQDYTIYVEKRLPLFKMNLRNKTGKNKSTLRHEIEHVKQFWDVIRLVGADNMAEEFRTNIKGLKIDITPGLLKKMHEIEKTLGRILPDSKEYKRAQQYLQALRNYPDIGNYYGIGIKELIKHFQYKKNLLEKEARQEAKNYKPTYIKTIKTTMKIMFEMLS